MSGIWTTCFIPPPEKTKKVKALTGSVIMELFLSKENDDRYLIFTLDSGETWKNKRKDISDTIDEWKKRHQGRPTLRARRGMR